MIKEILIKNKNYIFLFIFLCLSLYDIGNLDALRQGTEGFYLLISNEMYNDGYFLTPRLVGGNHWSKPPFHFWLPMPFQALLQGSYLTSARLSILFFTFISVFFISKWNEVLTKKSSFALFFFFTSSFCILKYSRIYMMESPFSLLIFISLLSFYLSSKFQSYKYLFISIFATAFAVLVKGPVSFAITGAVLGLYFFYEKFIDKNLDVRFGLNRLALWFFISLFLASLWFFYCYYTYGNEFYEYFFLRENLGKFSSKSYPISSVINGLLIYSFPLIIFLPRSFKLFLKKKDSLGFFLIFSFCVSFFIWFIPNQKSHHYAVPSTIPLILFIFNYFQFEKVYKIERRIINFFSIIISVLLFLVGLISINLDIPFFDTPSVFTILSILAVITLFLILNLISSNKLFYFFNLSIFYSLIWLFFLPIFLLPTVPSKVIDLTASSNVSVVFRKPYFIQEGLNKKIEIFGHDTIMQKIRNSNDMYIVPLDVFHSQNLSSVTEIIFQWPLWKRGLKPNQVIGALKTDKTHNLVEYLVLLKKQQ